VLSSARRWPSCFFLPARADAPAPPNFELLSSLASTLPARSDAGPCPARPALPPSPSSPSLDPSLSRPSRTDSSLLRPPRLDPSSHWLDRVFPPRSVVVVAFPADPLFPFYSAASALLLCRPRRSLTLERRLLPKNRLMRVSRPRPPRLWLPRRLGALVFLEHTLVSTPAATFAITTLRLRGDFNPSAPTFDLYSSLIVWCPRCNCGGMLDCVCECVWVGTTVCLSAH
jgi:hypothetical protein